MFHTILVMVRGYNHSEKNSQIEGETKRQRFLGLRVHFKHIWSFSSKIEQRKQNTFLLSIYYIYFSIALKQKSRRLRKLKNGGCKYNNQKDEDRRRKRELH
jgi:hypothetical protein